jgi:predicted DsbA family dithiol-disulfide isomerase
MHVEIWSDIACPWCYIGKRRFEAALARFEHRDGVRVTWRSFELDPAAPAVREEDAATHLARKYGTSRDQAQGMQDRLTRLAAEEGLDYRLDRLRLGSTLDAHRLVHLGAEHGIQDATKEGLFKAYLEEGRALGEHATLRAVANDVGLPAGEVADLLAGDLFTDAVCEDEETARRLGIAAVPFFVVDRALGVAGAQPGDVLLEMLRQGWERRTPLAATGGGESCGVDGC